MSNYDQLEFRHLKYILAVAETRSFSAGAVLAHTTQPNISTQIAHLEGILDIEIFTRGREGVVPTPYGEVLVACAKDLLQVLQDVLDMLRALRTGEITPLRLGYPNWPLQFLLLRVYRPHRKGGLPVRNLQFWIDTNILLLLKDAPFNKRDAQLVLAAGSCADCPKRTGHNKLLFGDDLGRQGDQCTDPTCYQAKMNAHVAKSIATKPELVQISTAYSQQRDGSAVLPRNKYTVIRDDRPKSKDEAKRPEFKECKFTAEAIITEGTDVGTVHKVCANPSCTVHHPKQQSNRDDEKWKAEQEKQRRDQAIANTTGLRILTAVGAAVPVRLLKRDLLFLIERLVTVLDESRIETLARQHGIRQKRDDGGIAKTLTAYLRRADESTLSRMLVEATVLLASPNELSMN